MTTENANTEITAEVETEQQTTAPPEAPDEFADADREKMGEVVRKERAAAAAARKTADRAEGRLAELEANELRRTVAEAKSLTPEQSAFLTGSTAEEMAAAADALVAAFGKPDPLRPRPVERTQRTGATGRTEGVDNMASVADKVMH